MSNDQNYDADDAYQIGYGHPPKGSRFKKGQSGNAKGRPKSSRNFNTDLDEILKGQITITEHGRPKKVSSQHAMLLRLREKALKGDPRALDRLIDLAQLRSDQRDARAEERELTKSEDDIFDRYLSLMVAQRGISLGGDDDGTDVNDSDDGGVDHA